ncbi:MAG: hypothetical protein OEM01_03190 [Desulfobulbaceae bacterium]|nr:hypothetical protein [Desulfobulbaceae bacterium]
MAFFPGGPPFPLYAADIPRYIEFTPAPLITHAPDFTRTCRSALALSCTLANLQNSVTVSVQ